MAETLTAVLLKSSSVLKNDGNTAMVLNLHFVCVIM